MKIEQTVEIDAPLEQVWALVNDVPRVAPCMPGAALTKVVDERTYEGTVQVKLGPIRMSYKGTVILEDVDEATHTARLSAKGRDVKGSGTASASVTCTLDAESPTRTSLHVDSDVQLTGKVASFGRGAIQDVAGKLFGQFAECLRDTLNAESAGAPPTVATEASGADGGPPPASGSGVSGSPAGVQSEPGRSGETVHAPPTPGTTAGTAGGAPPSTPTQPSRAPAETSLDAGSLVKTVVVGRAKAIGTNLAAFVRGLRIRLARRG